MFRSGFAHLLALVSVLVCACRNSAGSEPQPEATTTTAALAAPAPAPARVEISPTGEAPLSVEVEVVDTDESRQRGLMFRKQLAPMAGMLFLFERPEHHTFWMHNTLLPLDIIFIKSDWTVLGAVENATPLTDSPRTVPGESQYVLEVNAGFSRRYGLRPGTSMRYVPAGSHQGS
jgi:uncharacterized membrane protein (UPF0127 family)